MRRAFSLILAILLLLAIAAGCGKTSENPSAATSSPAASGSPAASQSPAVSESDSTNPYANKDTLVIGAAVEPKTLDMQNATLGGNYGIPFALYDTLFAYDAETQSVKTNVATKLEWVDNTTFNLEIRDDVYSSRGTHLTASDVLFTLTRGAAYSGLANQYRYFDVANSEVIDDTHLLVKLAAPYSGVDARLTLNCFGLVCQADVEAVGLEDFGLNPVGSGPYILTEWKQGESATLTRNDNYWGGKPYWNTMVFKFIPDANSRLLALQSGDVDIAEKLTASQASTVTASEDLNLVEFNIQDIQCIWLNLQKEPFNDPVVRQALNMAIDREAVNQAVFMGTANVVDGLFGSSNAMYTAPTADISYNVEKAKELLAEAGYPDGFDFTVLIYQDQTLSDMMQVVQNFWAQIGVNIEINTVDKGTFFTIIPTDDKDAYSIHCPGFLPDAVFSLVDPRNLNGGGNSTGYDNEALIALIDAANAETDVAKRNAIYSQMNDLFRNDYAFIPLCESPLLYAMHKGLDGIVMDPLGDPFFNFVAPTE